MRVLICAAALVVTAGCSSIDRQTLELATTTSVQNSGLLDVLIREYAAETGITLRVHAAGSGRALAMLEEGLVDAVIAHAPETEQQYLERHADWQYRKLAFNRFIIVGPADDPAGVGDAEDAVAAFAAIEARGATFVSRGDGSGTHERELMLWQLAPARPAPPQLVISGRGMALALRHADELRGYTLSDEATFGQLEKQISLIELFADDPRLLNTYAVITPPASAALRLMEWLTRGRGREHIGAFTVNDKPAFSVWPRGCPDTTPSAPLCRPDLP